MMALYTLCPEQPKCFEFKSKRMNIGQAGRQILDFIRLQSMDGRDMVFLTQKKLQEKQGFVLITE